MSKKSILVLSLTIGLLVGGLTIGAFTINNEKIGLLSTYTVTFDSNGGSRVRSIRVKSGEKIKKPDDPKKEGYFLADWLLGDEHFSFNNAIEQDITLTADWDCFSYKIKYDLDGGYISGEYATSYNVESEFNLVEPTKEDSLFLGWFNDDNEKVTSIQKGNTGDINLKAKWIDNRKIICEDCDAHISFDFDGSDDSSLIVKNDPLDGKMHLFKGWYNQNGELLSSKQDFVISIEELESTTIHAKYFSEEEENQWDIDHGFKPVYLNEEKSRVRYGFYPNHNVNDPDLIAELSRAKVNTKNGYYYYNHEYYYKRVGHLYFGDEAEYKQFSNGDDISEGKVYWFKVEPLSWKVLERNYDSLLLVSEVVTEAHQYFTGYKMREIDGKDIYPNNYEHSEIRSWLNGDFFSSTFCFDDSYIQVHWVDNSYETLYSSSEEFASPNTFDNVFLLSYKDYINRMDSKDRKIDATDLFMASGGLYGTNGNDFGKSYLWTRSPAMTDGYSVSKINRSGGVNTADGGSSYCGTQPAVYIDLIE